MAGRPVPGPLNARDGGGKDERRPLGCGLEKRLPCPQLTELGGDAPPFRAGSFTFDSKLLRMFMVVMAPIQNFLKMGRLHPSLREWDS
jgi:hypothetical protein